MDWHPNLWRLVIAWHSTDGKGPTTCTTVTSTGRGWSCLAKPQGWSNPTSPGVHPKAAPSHREDIFPITQPDLPKPLSVALASHYVICYCEGKCSSTTSATTPSGAVNCSRPLLTSFGPEEPSSAPWRPLTGPFYVPPPPSPIPTRCRPCPAIPPSPITSSGPSGPRQ